MVLAIVDGVPRNISGWRPARKDHRDALVPMLPPSLLPPSVDLSARCPPVFDQGALGSCTANAVVAMMESLFKKVNRPVPRLSRLFLYEAARVNIEGEDPSTDSGCSVRSGVEAARVVGCAEEALWPYDAGRYADVPPPMVVSEAAEHRITHFAACDGLSAAMGALAQGYTFVGGFSVPVNMMSEACARSGLVQYPVDDESIVGGHAVHFVGYDAKAELFTFQNSWGPGWGKQGFGLLPFKFVTTGLADDLWVAYNETMAP